MRCHIPPAPAAPPSHLTPPARGRQGGTFVPVVLMTEQMVRRVALFFLFFSGTAVGVRRVSVQLTCARQLLVTGSCALQRLFHFSTITAASPSTRDPSWCHRASFFFFFFHHRFEIRLLIFCSLCIIIISIIIIIIVVPELRMLHGSDTVACSRGYGAS